MIHDPSYYIKKTRLLSKIVFISGALNIITLALFVYWVTRERPPVPYFELKPANSDQEQLPLADFRNSLEVISNLRHLSFNELIGKLTQTQMIENGYSERDLTLSSLVAFHHFDIERALSSEPKEKRFLKWKNPYTNEQKILTIYPGLTDKQFDSISNFAKTEKWPLTSEGLFSLLQKQKHEQNIDPSLVETFVLTPQFTTFELLFNRSNIPPRKQNLLEVVLEGNWYYLKQFNEQQKTINDLSEARRQKILVDYIKQQSEAAAYLLLEMEWEFAIKKLEDAAVITILQLLPTKTPESERFALNLLTSPRSTSVWQQASLRLYEYAGESIPENWSYQTSLDRFAPTKENNKAEIPAVISVEPVLVKVQNAALKEPSKEVQKAKVAVSTKIAQGDKPKIKAVSSTSSTNSVSSVKPTTQPKKQPYRVYIVQEGDSLWKISRRFAVDMEALKQFNQLKTNAIKPGSVLKIP